MKYQGCQVEPKKKVTGGNKENQVQKRENTKVKQQARKKAQPIVINRPNSVASQMMNQVKQN